MVILLERLGECEFVYETCKRCGRRFYTRTDIQKECCPDCEKIQELEILEKKKLKRGHS
ncbi:MAG: hypothetical protein NZ922_05140 [Candidatus Methanomethyliaceae archaeon]|nr:hypothetical protein [Candidatus Methanomethyliaceae archaeon]MDW7970587.1 hypothetical protein [Nitrososphaerota archaeon]